MLSFCTKLCTERSEKSSFLVVVKMARETFTTCYICDACDNNLIPHNPCILVGNWVVSKFDNLSEAVSTYEGKRCLPSKCPTNSPHTTNWRLVRAEDAISLTQDFLKKSCINENGFIDTIESDNNNQEHTKQTKTTNRFSDIDLI